jgi:hypothetical protein
MSKRKNDDATHQSRIDFDQSADDEDSRGGGGGGGSFLRADPSTMASRRTVQASGLLSDGSGHGSKRFRRDNYQKEMTRLNDCFRRLIDSQVVPAITADIAARQRTGAVKEDRPPTLCITAVMEYIDKAAQHRAKYMPEIGDILTCGSGEMGQLGWQEHKLNSAMTFYRPQLVRNLRGLGNRDGIIAVRSEFVFLLYCVQYIYL